MLKNLIFYTIFFSGIIFISIIFLPTFILPQSFVLFGGKLMGYWTAFCLRIILSVNVKVLGKENISKDNNFFIAASHQSMFETFYLQTIFKSPIFILKKELLLIPIFGWYLKKIGSISIKRNKDNKLLGCCGFVYINWVHKHADLSLYIGWKEAYIDQEGYATDSCNLLLDYGFNELSLNKVWTEIYEFDKKKKELYDAIGFHQDGLLRQNYFYDGRWWDSRILSILKDEFKQVEK